MLEKNIDWAKMIHNPIIFKPERIYRLFTGGLLMEKLFGFDNPQDDHFGEAWYASTVEAAYVNPNNMEKSKIKEGLSTVEFEGEIKIFRELIKEFPETLIGKLTLDEFGPTVPLLAKILDSAVRHVVQCHPATSFSKKYFNFPSGKDEAWVILETRNNIETFPHLYLGFKKGITKKGFAPILKEGNSRKLLNFLHKIPVTIGETYYVPAGTPHAFGAGIMAIEIQDPADFTFRAEKHCFGINLSEAQRYLGVGFENTLDAFSYQGLTKEELTNKYCFKPEIYLENNCAKQEILLSGKPKHSFGIIKLSFKERTKIELTDEFCISMIINGKGEIKTISQQTNILPGNGLFFPAALDELEVIPEGKLEMIICGIKGFPYIKIK